MSDIKIIQGDCIEEMESLVLKGIKVDKIVTSPPYNIIRPNQDDRGYDEYNDGMSNEEYIRWTLRIFDTFSTILNANGCVLYNMSYGGENTECMSLTVAEIIRKTDFTLADIIVWKKNSAVPNAMSKNKLTRICEFVYIFVKRADFKTFNTNKKVKSYRNTGQANYENIFNFVTAKNNDGATKINKATYSTELMHKLFDIYVRPDDIVLDPFGGTGTTAVACCERGNDCYSIEKSEQQVLHSIERIQKLGTMGEWFD